jgi:predicted signal transduction protein with EAL and GGDEF domain
VPGFTSSFGVAHSHQAASLEEICRIADGALYRAKREGRDRIVTDDAGHQVQGRPREPRASAALVQD